MDAIINEFQHLSVNHLIDLLLTKSAELLAASDSNDKELVTRLTQEMQAIHHLIKVKRDEQK